MKVTATYAAEAPPSAKKATAKNQLDALKEMSKVVAGKSLDHYAKNISKVRLCRSGAFTG